MNLKISIFNVENLFHRSKVINKDNDIAKSLLNKIADLQIELDKAVYDKAKILRLYKELKHVIDISEDKGKLFIAKNRATMRAKAKGRADWDGAITFKKDKFSRATRKNTARVINEIDADIQGIVEVENRLVLNDFNSQLLNRRFDYNMVVDGNDRRGIDVGLLCKYPIDTIKTHIFDRKDGKKIFSRDCLEITLKLPNGQPITLLINHLKSKGYGDRIKSDARRKTQSEGIKAILKDYDLGKDLVVVMGDMNDTPDSAPLKPLLGTRYLYDVLKLQFGDDNLKRWTYYYNGYNQIDYLLVSKPLREAFKTAGVLRNGMPDINKRTKANEKRYSSITHKANSSSDHGAVWAEFDI